MVLDITKLFIHTNISPKKDGEEMVITKITGAIIDMLVELDSGTYRKNTVFENGKKVICVVLLRSIYRMLVAALLLYK